MREVSRDGFADVWSPEWRKARKEHQCCACGGTIRPSVRYVRLFTLSDGYKDSSKSCLPCWRAAEKFAEAHDRYHPHPTGLREMLEECVDWDSESARKWRPTLRAMAKRREKSHPVELPWGDR